jgi:hypothetical protein
MKRFGYPLTPRLVIEAVLLQRFGSARPAVLVFEGAEAGLDGFEAVDRIGGGSGVGRNN